MPKVSKAGPKKPVSQRSTPGEADILGRDPKKHYCTRCGRGYRSQKGNFPASQSPLYAANNNFLTVCQDCLEEMYRHYRAVLGGGDDDYEAIRRMCMKFDIYWHPDLFKSLQKVESDRSRMKAYIRMANLYQYKDRTFDDTLDEEALAAADEKAILQAAVARASTYVDTEDEPEEPPVDPGLIKFWGTGLAPSLYGELQARFQYWCEELNTDPEHMDAGTKSVLRQICNLEVQSNKDMAAGKSTDKLAGMINTLLGSANLKPVQKQEADKDGVNEKTPFGVWIRRWENERPVPELDPELQDVDGIIRYISIWFLGHLCKMLHIKNSYCKLYEDEIQKLRLERPEYEDEDDESFFNDIFARPEEGDGE